MNVLYITIAISTHSLCGMLQGEAWMAGIAPHYHTHFEEPCPMIEKACFDYVLKTRAIDFPKHCIPVITVIISQLLLILNE